MMILIYKKIQVFTKNKGLKALSSVNTILLIEVKQKIK